MSLVRTPAFFHCPSFVQTHLHSIRRHQVRIRTRMRILMLPSSRQLQPQVRSIKNAHLLHLLVVVRGLVALVATVVHLRVAGLLLLGGRIMLPSWVASALPRVSLTHLSPHRPQIHPMCLVFLVLASVRKNAISMKNLVVSDEWRKLLLFMINGSVPLSSDRSVPDDRAQAVRSLPRVWLHQNGNGRRSL